MRGAVDAEGAAAHIGAIEIEFSGFHFWSGASSSQIARNASLTLRSMVTLVVQETGFFANCWVIEEPPCRTPPACAVGDERARAGASDVDAEMVVRSGGPRWPASP